MENEPTYKYVRGVGWVPSIKPLRPATWAEACALICKNCGNDFGLHIGWRCDNGHSWPLEDRWEMENGRSVFDERAYR